MDETKPQLCPLGCFWEFKLKTKQERAMEVGRRPAHVSGKSSQ